MYFLVRRNVLPTCVIYIFFFSLFCHRLHPSKTIFFLSMLSVQRHSRLWIDSASECRIISDGEGWGWGVVETAKEWKTIDLCSLHSSGHMRKTKWIEHMLYHSIPKDIVWIRKKKKLPASSQLYFIHCNAMAHNLFGWSAIALIAATYLPYSPW